MQGIQTSEPTSIPYLEDTDVIPVPLTYRLVVPFVKQIDETSFRAIKGSMLYRELRRGRSIVMPYTKTPAENAYVRIANELDMMHRWALGYVDMKLESMSYVDFKRMHEILKEHVQGMEDIVALNDSLCEFLDANQWIMLRDVASSVINFYDIFTKEVVSPTSLHYITERVRI